MAHRPQQSSLNTKRFHQDPPEPGQSLWGLPSWTTSVVLTSPPMLQNEEGLSFLGWFRPVSQHSALLSLTNLTPFIYQAVFVGLPIKDVSILPNCLSRRKGMIFLGRKVRGRTQCPRVPNTKYVIEQPVSASAKPGLSLPSTNSVNT